MENNKQNNNTAANTKSTECSVHKKCGGCIYSGLEYDDQIRKKQINTGKLIGKFGHLEPMIRMNYPLYYRHKVHHAFDRDRKGNIISGSYMKGTRKVVPVNECILEDKTCQRIIKTIREMIKPFKLKVYDEDTGTGLFKHVMIRKGHKTNEIMVILVTASPIFPSKNNFAKALKEKHPEITTIIMNVNPVNTGMVLGERNTVLYGPGVIKDKLCGCTFTISPNAFFQVNPQQTEKLYNVAMEYAQLGESETVIDAYCGTGTIGIIAAKKMAEARDKAAADASEGQVIGVDLNSDSIKDAKANAKENKIKNAKFYTGDAGEFMERMLANKQKADVVFLDPPRSGSTKKFLDSVIKLRPKRIVYISCGPDTLARDLAYLTSKKYKVEKMQPVDMFPYTEHVECVALLSKHS